MKQSSCEQSLNFFGCHSKQFPHLTRVDLSASHVTVSGLILRIDRNRQGLDCIHVNICHLLQILVLLFVAVANFVETILIEAIQQMNQPCDEEAEKNKRPATAVDC